MSNGIVYVLSYPRPKTGYKYLINLLCQLKVFDYQVRLVVDQPVISPTEIPNTLYSELSLSGGVGNTAAMQHMIHWAAQFTGPAILLEDDIVLEQGGLQRLYSLRVPEDLGVVYGTDMQELPEGWPEGLYQCPVHGKSGLGVWGTQVVLYPAETLRCLQRCMEPSSSNPLLQGHIDRHGTLRNAADVYLSAKLRMCGYRNVGILVPSIAKHIGEDSSCFPDQDLNGRVTRNLPPSLR